jgi:hypothetical protein
MHSQTALLEKICWRKKLVGELSAGSDGTACCMCINALLQLMFYFVLFAALCFSFCFGDFDGAADFPSF